MSCMFLNILLTVLTNQWFHFNKGENKMIKQDVLSQIVNKLAREGLSSKQNKIQIFKNYGQMDPNYLFGEDFVIDQGDESFVDLLSNRMRGYSANIITQKSADNRIYWQDNDEVTQNKTHYLGKTLVDTLALETEDGVIIYNSFGRPLNHSDRSKIISDKTFEQTLSDLKNVTEGVVKKVIALYDQKINESYKKGEPLLLKDKVIEQNRNYNIMK